MLADFSIFVPNIYLLIGLLIVLAVGLALLLATLTGVNLGIWHLLERRERTRQHAERYRPDGEPYPPAGRGICDRCGRPFEKVYHMPSGERLCPEDYNDLHGG